MVGKDGKAVEPKSLDYLLRSCWYHSPFCSLTRPIESYLLLFTGPVIHFLCLFKETIGFHQQTALANALHCLLQSPFHLISSVSLSVTLIHPHPSNNIPFRPSTQPRLRTSITTKQPDLHPLPHIILLPPSPTIDLIIDHLSHRVNTAAPIQRIRVLGALVAVDVEIEAVGPIASLGSGSRRGGARRRGRRVGRKSRRGWCTRWGRRAWRAWCSGRGGSVGCRRWRR